MTQEWLNHLMMPLIELLDLIEIANSFLNCEQRLTIFGKFYDTDLI